MILIWIERSAWIILTLSLIAHNWSQNKTEIKLRARIRKLLYASTIIAVAANRDVREYDASPITEGNRQRGNDTSIMVVARVSVWREFIAAVRGE